MWRAIYSRALSRMRFGSRATPRSIAASVVSGARLFMRASLDGVDVRILEAAPDKRLTVWLYSLGAVNVLGETSGLDSQASLDAAIGFFAA